MAYPDAVYEAARVRAEQGHSGYDMHQQGGGHHG
jgi:hypothetical protein